MTFTLKFMEMPKKLILKGDPVPLKIYYIALVYKNDQVASLSILTHQTLSQTHQKFTVSSEHMQVWLGPLTASNFVNLVEN